MTSAKLPNPDELKAVGRQLGMSLSDAPRMEIIQRAFEMLPNTAPFDVTGHPSMSVPCGMSDGLPAGMMLTAKHFDEVAIYRAASAFEKAGDWRGVRP